VRRGVRRLVSPPGRPRAAGESPPWSVAALGSARQPDRLNSRLQFDLIRYRVGGGNRRAGQLAAPEPAVAAFTATTRAAVGPSPNSTARSATGTTLAAHFDEHPDADLYRSLPGLGVILAPGCG
jgi:hypothetical protein